MTCFDIVKYICRFTIYICLSGAIIGPSLLYYYQDTLLYLPNLPFRYNHECPENTRSPDDRSLVFEDVQLESEKGVVLRGWYIKQRTTPKQRRLVVFFHENAGPLGIRLDNFEVLNSESKVDILAFAYRGYTDSDGTPTEEGIKSDTHAIMKYVKDTLSEQYVDSGGIFLLGRSLGGAVAVEALTDDTMDMIDGVILENTFTSISDMVDVIFPFLV